MCHYLEGNRTPGDRGTLLGIGEGWGVGAVGHWLAVLMVPESKTANAVQWPFKQSTYKAEVFSECR